MNSELRIIAALAAVTATQWVIIGVLAWRARVMARHTRVALDIAAAAAMAQLHEYEEGTPMMAWFDGEENVVTAPARSVRYWLN